MNISTIARDLLVCCLAGWLIVGYIRNRHETYAAWGVRNGRIALGVMIALLLSIAVVFVLNP